MPNREGAKDAKENDFFRIGTRRRLWLWRGKRTIRKDSSPPGILRILSGHSSSSIGGEPFSEAD